jgi:hypothetical protein
LNPFGSCRRGRGGCHSSIGSLNRWVSGRWWGRWGTFSVGIQV